MTGAELRALVSADLERDWKTSGRKYYAGFSHFELLPDPTGSYHADDAYWLVSVTLKGATRPDEKRVAFVSCDGSIEYSHSN